LTDEIFDAAISGLTERTIDRLRVELAKERERADAHYRVLECVSSKRDELRAELAAKDRTLGENIRQTLLEQKRAEAAEAERDELRALLGKAQKRLVEKRAELEEYCELESGEDYNDPQLNDTIDRIDAALKGDNRE